MSNPTTITVNASAWARVTRERDEARDMVHGLRKQRAIARKFGEQMERERDEARKALREIASLDTCAGRPARSTSAGAAARCE
jgi:hypothetical protein